MLADNGAERKSKKNMTSIKRIPKEKVAILHSCTEKETLNRLSALLVGNGHPEDGYVYKVIEMGKQMKDINDKLSGISTVVNDLYKESIEKKAVREDHKINWVKVIQVLGVVIALGMLIIALAKVNEKADKVLTGIGRAHV